MISAACIPDILSYQGDAGLKGALTPFNSKAEYFSAEDETCIIDMDTPEDYKKVLALEARLHQRLFTAAR